MSGAELAARVTATRSVLADLQRDLCRADLPEHSHARWLGRLEARACALDWIGREWCDMYGPQSWAEVAHLFPRGELARRHAGGRS